VDVKKAVFFFVMGLSPWRRWLEGCSPFAEVPRLPLPHPS
jgi:hypothetical protein